MKPISRFFTLVTVLAFWMVGCGEESSTGPDTDPNNSSQVAAEDESIAEDIPFDPEAIYVERMYATSIGSNGPEYLLDGDPSTGWDAMAGAGPNEGVMLYFEEPVEVGTVLIRSKDGNNTVQSMDCYVNGATKGSIKPNEEKKIDEMVQSMFVSISRVKGEEEMEFGEYPYCTIYKYPSDLKVELTEIELKDKSGNALKVRPLHHEAGEVVSSSVLEPAEAYNADFLFDSNLEFGWAEGKEDEGIGESIDFIFQRAIRIEKIKLWNGYQRSESHFERNARAKSISFGLMGGEEFSFDVPDQRDPVELELPIAMEGNEFKLTVNDFYPGESYKDLVLSEMRFFDGNQWFGLHGSGFETRKSALQDRIKGSFLADLIDRPLAELQDREEFGDVSYSLTLRSNGSFVLYRNRTEGQDDQVKGADIREVADGNWSIQSLDKPGSVAKVKIFGKLNRIMEKEYWYKGNKKSNLTRIFSEILTITPQMVKGQKLIEAMHLEVPEGESDATGQVEDQFETRTQYAFPGGDVIPEFQVTLEG